jgi:delta 1-pyrroline-5-carboxylate dehydrogenase
MISRLSSSLANNSRWKVFVQPGKRSLSSFKTKYGPYINGKEIMNSTSENPSPQTYKLYTPHSKQYLTEVENTSEQLTNHAIETAHEVFQSGIWSKSDVRHRAKVLQNIADILRKEFETLLFYEVSQTGRPIKEMRAQVRLCCFFGVSFSVFSSFFSFLPSSSCLAYLNGLNILLL